MSVVLKELYTVRKLKESLAVLRGDLNRQGLDIQYNYEGVRDVITYLALMNNHFGRSGGTGLSPLETSAGRSLSKPVTSMFGSTVIAEIPDSIRQYLTSLEALKLRTFTQELVQVQLLKGGCG